MKYLPINLPKNISFSNTALHRKKQKTRVNTGFYTGYRTLSHCLKLAFGADGET